MIRAVVVIRLSMNSFPSAGIMPPPRRFQPPRRERNGRGAGIRALHFDQARGGAAEGIGAIASGRALRARPQPSRSASHSRRTACRSAAVKRRASLRSAADICGTWSISTV